MNTMFKNRCRNKIVTKNPKVMKVRMGVTVLLLLIAMFATLAGNKVCKAASASVSFETKQTEYKPGDEFSLIIKTSSDVNIGAIELYITYDDELVEFKTGGSTITGGSGLLRLSDSDFEEESASKKYAVTFKAKDTGICDFKMSNDPLIYDQDGATMSVSSNSSSINISKNATASNNNDLSSLKVSPGTIDPVFDTKNTTYTLKVPADTKNVVVSAETQDAKAKVTVQGNKDLKDGENKIIITVKSQSGDQKEYSIAVTREGGMSPSPLPQETSSPEPTDVSQTPAVADDQGGLESGGNQLQVEEKDGETYLVTSYRLRVAKLTDTTMIPSGYIQTELVLDDVNIVAYTLEDDLENDFLLIYAYNEEQEPTFYQYDRVEKTLQRYVAKTSISEDSDNKTVFTTDAYNERVNQLAVIIAVLSAVIASLIIYIIHFTLKRKGMKDDLD